MQTLSLKNVPVARPKPDASRFVDIMMGRANGAKPPLVEYIVDDVVLKPVITDLLGLDWIDRADTRSARERQLDSFIEFWLRMGYDLVRYETGLPFRLNQIIGQDPTRSDKSRSWMNQHQGAISTWEDFERYPWPEVTEANLYPLIYINDRLPEGMGLIASHGGGIFEHLSFIVSIEGLCIMVLESPDLVKSIADKIGALEEAFYRLLLQLDRLVAVFPGDDMGFRTGLLISPDHMRELVLPWHKRFAQMAHDRGLPYFLHSCGNLFDIIDNLIDDVGIDAKHSYEDAIMPVQDFHARYGDRIGVLGGLDINILSGGSMDDVRRHTRFLMEVCGARGRYAIGSGNSIPSYVPVDNYLAMIDEAVGFVP